MKHLIKFSLVLTLGFSATNALAECAFGDSRCTADGYVPECKEIKRHRAWVVEAKRCR